MYKTKKKSINLNERKELYELIIKTRFPDGLSGKVVKFDKVYSKLLKMKKIPKYWESSKTLQNFFYQMDAIFNEGKPIRQNSENKHTVRLNYSEQYGKKELLQLIIRYRYPNGIDGDKRSYFEIFSNMQKEGVLPRSWNNPATLHKFMRRSIQTGIIPIDWDSPMNIKKILSEEFKKNTKVEIDNGVIEKTEKITSHHELKGYIYSMMTGISFSIIEIFEAYWIKLTRDQKKEFMNKIIEEHMKKGIAINEICSVIVKEFKEIGILNDNTIRLYIDDKYKDEFHRSVKIGKTFKASGRETTEDKKLKEIGGKKLFELERKQTELEIENIKMQKEILDLKEKKSKGAI